MALSSNEDLLVASAIVRSKNGFLLDIKNSSSVSQTYLTVAEYISDQNKMLDDLARMQDTFRHQQETYHAQQQRTLSLLTTQLQQRFQMIENRYGKNNETKQAMEALERKYMNLERMYTSLKETMNSKDLLYQELAQNYTQMQDVLTNQDTLCKYNYSKIQQEIERIEADCNTQVSMITNKTIAVEHKVGRLEQANSIHQLSLQNLKEEMQHCYSKINILTSHEQAHNQDFLALYNLTKLSRSDIHELANKTNMQLKLLEETHNLSFSSIQQKENQNFHTLYNLSSISIRKMNALANQTNRQFGLLERNQNLSFSTFEQNKKHEFRNFTSQIDALGKSTIRRFEILERNQNLSYSTLQKNIEKNGQKVVLTSCDNSDHTISPGVMKFSSVITAVGIQDIASFTTTGKFTCQIPGIYHITVTVISVSDGLMLYILKNSKDIHHQHIIGKTGLYWEEGTMAVALELKGNDTVWVQTPSNARLHNSCITIYKI